MVCTGLFNDENETPGRTMRACRASLPCGSSRCSAPTPTTCRARPPLVYCAGALAEIYEEDGGKVTYAGKPYKPIYELAEETIARLGERWRGARSSPSATTSAATWLERRSSGLDSVFVASGLHVGPGG